MNILFEQNLGRLSQQIAHAPLENLRIVSVDDLAIQSFYFPFRAEMEIAQTEHLRSVRLRMRGQRLRVKRRKLFDGLNHSFPQRFASCLNPACLADFIAQISHLLYIACGISTFSTQIQHTRFRSQFNARTHFSQMVWMHCAIIFGADFAPIQIGNLHHLIVHLPYQRLSVRNIDVDSQEISCYNNDRKG